VEDIFITLTRKRNIMKRFYATRTGLAILSLMIGLSLATTAAARPRGHGRDRLTRLEHQIERLDFDRETQTSVYAIIDQARAEQRETRRQIRKSYEALRALLEQDAPDETAVLAQADVIGALQTTYRKQSLRTLFAVQAQLTPEQRASLRKAMQDRTGKHRGRRR
jgi:Spy/CpxP family protein refolding chaperone